MGTDVISMEVGASLVVAVISFVVILRWLQRRLVEKRIVIFSRYPEANFAKTRLVPELGTDGAAAVQRLLTDHILQRVQEFVASSTKPDIGIDLQFTGGSIEKVAYWLERQKNHSPHFKWTPQSIGHLGERMSQAFCKAFDEGAKTVILIGSDIPGITSDVLSEAFNTLESDPCEMVLGPAKDGGYYLVGLSVRCHNDLSTLFEGIDWGTSSVYQQQLSVAQNHGLHVHTLSTELQDIDEAEDLPEFEEKLGISLDELKAPVLSAVIPTYNEEGSILSTLTNVVECSKFTPYMEIIVSDGGSSDSTKEKVQEFAKSCSTCNVSLVESGKGRGLQLNTGVKHSNGYHLIFVHADTTLPRAFDGHVMVTLAEPGVVCGAFEFALDVLQESQTHEEDEKNDESENHTTNSSQKLSSFFSLQMQVLSWFTNRRAKKYELPYGDQGLFMTRRIFDQVGGFPEFKLMEDYAMVKTLQRIGHVKVVDGEKAVTSARRWMKHGLVKITGFNRLMVILYNLGVSTETLARWYYRFE